METSEQKIARLQQEIEDRENELRILQLGWKTGDEAYLKVTVTQIDLSDGTLRISYPNYAGDEQYEWVLSNQISKIEST